MSNDKLAQALRDIIDPFDYLERNLPEGYRLDGQAALQQINSREFYARIAREALAAAPNVQPKGAANPVVWTDAAILSLMNRVGDGPFGEEDVAVTRRFMGHVEEIRSELFAAQAPAPGTEAHTLIKQCRDALASAPAVNPATTRVCGHFAPASAPASAEGDDLPPLPAATWPRNVGTPSWTAEEVQAYARSALARVQPKGADAEQEWNYVIECRDGFVPNVKGPFNKQFTESTLREFAAMRPSYLMVVRSTGWPSIESGVEWIDAFGDKRRGRLAVQSPAPGDLPSVEEQRELLKRLRHYGDNDLDAACALIERLCADLYAAEGRTHSLAQKLAEAQGCINGWVTFGGNVTDALGLRVMYPKQILAEIARLSAAVHAEAAKVPAPAPSQGTEPHNTP